MEKLLSTKETANLVQVSESILRKQRMDGHRAGHMPTIPYIKMGKTVRYRLSDINTWLEMQIVSNEPLRLRIP